MNYDIGISELELTLEDLYCRMQEDPAKSFTSAVVIGHTGIGKTAVIKKWLNKIESPSYIFGVNTRPHQISMITSPDGGTVPIAGCYFTNDEIEYIDRPGMILFLDMCDLTDAAARSHILRLVRERTVTLFDGSEKQLENVAMIIATAFPESHFGYEVLSDQECDNFEHVIRVSTSFAEWCEYELGNQQQSLCYYDRNLAVDSNDVELKKERTLVEKHIALLKHLQTDPTAKDLFDFERDPRSVPPRQASMVLEFSQDVGGFYSRIKRQKLFLSH
jgi:hypothetical protein